jgi:hypothetical protein
LSSVQIVHSSLEQWVPNWQLEWRNFQAKEDSSWQPASKRSVLTDANAIPVRISAFKRLALQDISVSN